MKGKLDGFARELAEMVKKYPDATLSEQNILEKVTIFGYVRVLCAAH